MNDTMPTGWGGEPISLPSLSSIQQARQHLPAFIVHTPLLFAKDPSIHLKPETLQPTGAYKVRGVWNWATSLSPSDHAQGLSTHSSGNTALALGYVARALGCHAKSRLPDKVPQYKIDAMKSYGVDPHPMPMADLIRFIFEEQWRTESSPFLNPWADPLMLAGNGTIGLEIVEDLKDVESLIVPLGGGGLLIGVAAALKAIKPDVRVIAVQPETCAPFQASLEANRAVWIEPEPTICDGTALPLVVAEAFPVLRELIDRLVLVSEDEVRRAMDYRADEHKLIVEGSGAMSLAAAWAVPESERGCTVCILSGGNKSR